jgi:hypothetical protein
MRFILALSVIAATTVLITSSKAQNYPWCAIYGGYDEAGQIAVSRPSSSAWPPREGSAVIVSRIRNMCLHPDRIRRRGFEGTITTKRAVTELAPAA